MSTRVFSASNGLLRLISALWAAALVVGCANRPVPTYPPMDASASLALMRQRSVAVESITGQGDVVLDDPIRGSVRLDTVYVMRPPGHARVRAWKLGHAVFDLTATPGGVWLYAPDEPESPVDPIAAPRDTPTLSDALATTSEALPDWMAVLWGRVSDDAASAKSNSSQSIELTPETLVTARSLPANNTLRCTIDRRTLTTRRAEVINSQQTAVFTLELDDYRDLEGVAWPCEIRAISSGGRITILTRSITLNAAPESAFTQPARAKKLR